MSRKSAPLASKWKIDIKTYNPDIVYGVPEQFITSHNSGRGNVLGLMCLFVCAIEANPLDKVVGQK